MTDHVAHSSGLHVDLQLCSLAILLANQDRLRAPFEDTATATLRILTDLANSRVWVNDRGVVYIHRTRDPNRGQMHGFFWSGWPDRALIWKAIRESGYSSMSAIVPEGDTMARFLERKMGFKRLGPYCPGHEELRWAS